MEKIETDKCVADLPPGGRRRSSLMGLPSAEDAASCFSKAFFTFVSPLAFKGVQAPLEFEDLQGTVKSDKTEAVFRRLSPQVPESEKFTLARTIVVVWWKEMLSVALWKQPANLAAWLRPMILDHLLLAMAYDLDSKYEVYGHQVETKVVLCFCVVSMVLAQVVMAVTDVRSQHLATRVALQAKHALCAFFTDRILKLGSGVVTEFGSGRIFNIMATDIDMAVTAINLIGLLFSLPVRTCLLIPLLIQQTGMVATMTA
eukprot:2232020-Amphidinium_carterae.1